MTAKIVQRYLRRWDTVGSVRSDLFQYPTFEVLLWAGVGIFLSGDVLTTAVGLHAGLVESNPVGRALLDTIGLVGLLAAKTLVVSLSLAVLWAADLDEVPSLRLVTPAGLAIVWGVATLSNATLLLKVY